MRKVAIAYVMFTFLFIMWRLWIVALSGHPEQRPAEVVALALCAFAASSVLRWLCVSKMP